MLKNSPNGWLATFAGLVLAVLVCVLAVPAAQAKDSVPGSGVADKATFGALLDWADDSAAGHAGRLGAAAAIYGRTVSLPMNGQEQSYLNAYFAQLAAEGTDALLTVEPRSRLAEVTADAAAVLAGQIADASANFEGTVYVRFAPDMNAPWVSWGQQPDAYRAAFAAVASAVRSTVQKPVIVWSPAAARDYPFREATSQPPAGVSLESLDTTADGIWNQDDAAYAPYYPGDRFVDWAGLSVYHDPTGDGPARNTLPEATGFITALDPSGTGPGVDDFYSVYGQGRGKPVMVETGAFYSPEAGGATERDIKSRWWEQVFTAAGDGQRPALRAVIWNETLEERGNGTLTIDWRATRDPVLAGAFKTALEASGLRTGPVTERSPGVIPAAEEPREVPGTVLTGWAAWAAVGTLVLAVGLLWVFSGRAARNRWAYDRSGNRDARMDMLRGMAIVFVVVNHVGISSAFQLLTQETIGVVSGAELFVLLSGVILGMVHGPRAGLELGEVVGRTGKRAWTLYVTALAVVLSVYALSLLPFINAAAVTTFTGQGGSAAAGTTYDLYAGMDGLLQFPPPQGLIPALLLLQIGPWQFNIMGLYVILLLVSPLILAALARRLAWLVLTASLALYTAGSVFRFRLLPSQFEDSFPLLVWQVLFILGVVAGYYRNRLVGWFSHPRRRLFLAGCLLAAAAAAVFSWTGPYLTNGLDVRLGLLPEQTFRQIYDGFFNRTYLGAGRLLNVLLITIALYTLLSAYWKPLEKALGWFLIPLGQATLYVFIMHVFLILAVANVPLLREGHLWLNTAAYVLLFGILWGMVKTRFLFRLIPR